MSDPLLVRPMPFECWTEPFLDTTRPTEPSGETGALSERALPTTIYLPRRPDPCPLIVFCHGLTGHPDKFTGLLSAWAEAGYAIAAPTFPTTNDRVPSAPDNYRISSRQPGDVSFVIDRVLAANQDLDDRLGGRIDVERIAVAGLSLGGATTYSVVFGRPHRDDRVKAAAVFAGGLLPIMGEVELDGHVPLLIVHGDEDAALVLSYAVEAWRRARGPSWFVTLLGAEHAPPFEDEESVHDEMVRRFTVEWWDATLGRDPDAYSRFEDQADIDGLSILQSRL
jgi:dienelactone hydrolase